MTTVKLKPDELAAFKEAFDMFDKKGDGSISTKVGQASMAKKGENLRIEFCHKRRNLISFFTGAACSNEASRSKSYRGRGEIIFGRNPYEVDRITSFYFAEHHTNSK